MIEKNTKFLDSDSYSLDIIVTAYNEDLSYVYFSGDSGYDSPRTINNSITQKIYHKVTSYYTNGSGTFAIKVVNNDSNDGNETEEILVPFNTFTESSIDEEK